MRNFPLPTLARFACRTTSSPTFPSVLAITFIGRKGRSPGIKAKFFRGTASIWHGRVAERYFRRRDDSRFTAAARRKTFVDSIRASTCGHRPRVPHGYTDMARTCNRANPHGHERHAAEAQPRPRFKFSSACSGFLLRRQITRVPTGRALLSPAATWLSAATSRDHPGACYFPSASLRPRAFASSDALATYSLGRQALTPLAIFGRARLLVVP
jgi:hypothetical protein